MVPEASTTARRAVATVAALVLGALLAGIVQGVTEEGSEEQAPDLSKAVNPVPFTEASIERGRVQYKRRCTECHGLDGKGQMDLIADATDLTAPDLWYNGTEEWQVFRSIREGAGESMPPYKFYFPNDRDIWDLVNYVLSLWPEGRRPALVDDSGNEASGDDGGEASSNEGGSGS